MSAVINNILSTDTFVATPCKITLTGAVKVTIQVNNNAVMMRPTFRDVDGTTTLGGEVFLSPGVYTLVRPVNLIEFRSALTGLHARVTAEALLGSEA